MWIWKFKGVDVESQKEDNDHVHTLAQTCLPPGTSEHGDDDNDDFTKADEIQTS